MRVRRENSLTRHRSDQHPRDASTCSRVASLGLSGAQHDKIGDGNGAASAQLVLLRILCG
jgi:hypothetical protein